MSILVTGGKGFIGSRVIRALVEKGEQVVCLEPKASPGRLADISDRITMVEGDVVRYDDVAETIATFGVDRVAHMVFFSAEERGVAERPEQPEGIYKQQMIMNTGTFNVLEAARKAEVRRLVFPSSVQYHGFPWTGPQPVNEESPALPTNSYGIGKHLCEQVVREYNHRLGTDYVIVRVPGVYGPGVRIGARGVNLIGTDGALGRPVIFPYPPEQSIVLAHVDDIAEIVSRALLMPKLPHDTYHIGGHYVTYGEMAEIGKRLIPDMEVRCSVVAPMGQAYRIDCSRMEREIGVHHRSLEDGYRELMNLSRVQAGRPPVA